ncbi:energy-coupling factor transporter transmembrane component T [Levilactobacillus tongjiangensis]|uniref:Energy-coupling factor transporter transmembrane component T n=1 Tax=Levilactobacillus tongjiangensis TaxID=2486023 RepID=A0ABW1SS36_9LACO|nr:energy-coupling factor transporter transmembrane component T [Levilactobacillus tongjiangensis]
MQLIETQSSQFLGQCHPLALVLYFGELFTGLLLFNHILITGLFFLGLCGLCCWYFGGRAVWRVVRSVLSLMGLILFLNILLNRAGVSWWQFTLGTWHWEVSRVGVLYGATMALSLGGMVMAFVLFNGCVTASQLRALLNPVAPRLAMLLTLAIRFVNLFIQQFRRLLLLQRTRGLVVTAGPWRHRLTETGNLLRVLLLGSISRAMETAILMEARGYGGRHRSQYQHYRWRLADTSFTLVAGGMFVVILGLRVHGWGVTPNIYSLPGVLATDWWVAGVASLVVGLPLIGEGLYRLCQN